ncbi:MAG: hypothetical protein JWO57_2071 [Pseudonocardiales bacterium]|nr:hypothetical protein [Pseudonocardiales bacterium]
MLPVGWLLAAVVVAVLLTMWVTFTLTRLDRLHARVDAAQAALDAQLVRRAAALLHVAEAPDSGVAASRREHYEAVARAALNLVTGERQGAENAVGRAVSEIVQSPTPVRADAVEELREGAARVLIARRFYNDAVRDTRTLRARRMPRLLRLAGRRAVPQFFDIDDTLPAAAQPNPPATSETEPPRPETAKESS